MPPYATTFFVFPVQNVSQVTMVLVIDAASCQSPLQLGLPSRLMMGMDRVLAANHVKTADVVWFRDLWQKLGIPIDQNSPTTPLKAQTSVVPSLSLLGSLIEWPGSKQQPATADSTTPGAGSLCKTIPFYETELNPSFCPDTSVPPASLHFNHMPGSSDAPWRFFGNRPMVLQRKYGHLWKWRKLPTTFNSGDSTAGNKTIPGEKELCLCCHRVFGCFWWYALTVSWSPRNGRQPLATALWRNSQRRQPCLQQEPGVWILDSVWNMFVKSMYDSSFPILKILGDTNYTQTQVLWIWASCKFRDDIFSTPGARGPSLLLLRVCGLLGCLIHLILCMSRMIIK